METSFEKTKLLEIYAIRFNSLTMAHLKKSKLPMLLILNKIKFNTFL